MLGCRGQISRVTVVRLGCVESVATYGLPRPLSQAPHDKLPLLQLGVRWLALEPEFV